MTTSPSTALTLSAWITDPASAAKFTAWGCLTIIEVEELEDGVESVEEEDELELDEELELEDEEEVVLEELLLLE